MRAQGFIDARHNNIVVAATPEELMESMLTWQPPASNAISDAKLRFDESMKATAIGQDISGTH